MIKVILIYVAYKQHYVYETLYPKCEEFSTFLSIEMRCGDYECFYLTYTTIYLEPF